MNGLKERRGEGWNESLERGRGRDGMNGLREEGGGME